MKDIPQAERASFGKAVNDARTAVIDAFNAKNAALESAALNAKLEKEQVDITLPGVSEAMPPRSIPITSSSTR
jgi:phenylalanyl-tRNA synthetase alpha chain